MPAGRKFFASLAATALILWAPPLAASPSARYIIQKVNGLLDHTQGLPLDIRALAPALKSYYSANDAQLLWSDPGRYEEFLAALAGLEDKGLAPTSKAIRRLGDMKQASRSSDADLLALLEVTFSSYLLRYVSDLRLGRMSLYEARLDPRTRSRTLHPDAVLRLARESTSFEGLFDDIQPHEFDYRAIRTRLEHFVALSKRGGWLPVAPGDDLATGDRGPRVVDVKRRLAASGELTEMAADGNVFDDALTAAVRLFQRRHNLAQTGKVDRRTMLAMNVPLSDRIEQLQVNLERWRWFDDLLPGRRWIINTATQRLYVRLPDKTERSFKLALSQPCRQRPAFDTTASYLIIDPAYTVPQQFAVRHLLPLLQTAPDKLDHSFKILLQSTDRPPKRIDWSAYDETNFPFTVVQQPGPTNALGRFQIPLQGVGDVSLHGRPDARSRSQLPEACVAILPGEGPLVGLLPALDELAAPDAAKAMEERTQRRVDLDQPEQVIFIYATVWRDTDGELVFAADPLARDAEIRRLIQPGRVS